MDDLLKHAIAYVKGGAGLEDKIENIHGLVPPSGSRDSGLREGTKVA